ncbi:hypothetical protein D3C79_1112840 [compost metagenome]
MAGETGHQRGELDIETAGTGFLQNGVAPAVAQYPVGEVAPLLGEYDQLLLGIELRCGGRQPEAI